jgi:hypothetical protein
LQTIHFFVNDLSFINNTNPVSDLLQADGIGIISQTLVANYVQPKKIRDPRSSRSTGMNAQLGNTLSVITDGASSVSTFVTDYSTLWSLNDQLGLFNMIDQLCFTYNPSNTTQLIDNTLTSNPSKFPNYVAGSLRFSTSHSTANVYLGSSPDSIIVPDTVEFTLNVTDLSNGVAKQYDVVLWMNGTLFDSEYPVSTITAVIPPLNFPDLLNKPITTLADNALAIAKESAQVNLSDLTAPIGPNTTETPITEGVSGYVAYNAKFVDTAGNFIFMPFNILYKGHIPGTLAIRQAIRNILLTSGTGTQAQWQARIPELFINAVFYLIPMWDNTTTIPNSTIFPDIIPIFSSLINKTEIIFYDVSPTFVEPNIQATSSVYDGILLTAIPDQANATNRLSLLAEHPTYQALASTDPNFQYMAALTKQYAIQLANALPVAAGDVTNNSFAVVSINQPSDPIQRNFLTWTVGDVEYYLCTKETFLNLLASPPTATP